MSQTTAPPPIAIVWPPAWIVLTPADRESAISIDPTVEQYLDGLVSAQPGTVLVGWLSLPLESESGKVVGGIVGATYGFWVQGPMSPPAPLTQRVLGRADILRTSNEQRVMIGGVESVWYQVTYFYGDLAADATFVLVFASPNLPLSEGLTDHFDAVASTVSVPR